MLQDPNKKKSIVYPLTYKEQNEIAHKVEFELIDKQYQIIKIGILINFIGGIIVLFTFYNRVHPTLLLTWFGALTLIDIIGLSLAFYYQYHKRQITQIKLWQYIYRIIVGIICLLWGSISILFASSDVYYQFFLVFVLFILIVGLGLGNILDFPSALISILCLLIPYSIFWLFLTNGHGVKVSHKLNMQFGVSLLALGIFLVVASYIGFVLITRMIKLSFINVFLSKKLEIANKVLEHKVKERTLELENSLKRATYLATHDPLTGLPNRRLLIEYIRTAIRIYSQNNTPFIILLLSINELEKINNAFGHKIRDFVIQIVSERLRTTFTKALTKQLKLISCYITLSRNDELVMLLQPFSTAQEVEMAAGLIFSILDEPIFTKKQKIKLTASMGGCFYPKDGTDTRSLLMNAHAAMMRQKKQGGNGFSLYLPEVNADISRELEMENDLYAALQNHEFTLLYQPIVDVKHHRICGMEALIRWKHPTMGFVPPNIFIQLAEANGMIVPLGDWILQTAAKQIKFWHAHGFDYLKMAVNLSARQLQQKDLVSNLSNILKKFRLKPNHLELELTETEAFKDEAIPILKQFTSMGLDLSIDDFGTGFSGLTNLKLIKINKLKIDKSFVQDLESSDESKAIVSNIIELARKLGIIVCAEGVETRNQLKYLLDLGCDQIQGYYFSRPITAVAFTQLLQNNKNLSFDDGENEE